MIPSKTEMQKALSCRVGEDIASRLNGSKVAVLGLGGLGSNVCIALARAGVGHLIICDFDKVDITNLNRQQYKASQIGMKKTDALKENLLEIAPYIDVITVDKKVSEENIYEICKDADVICEAFDKADNKAMLVNFVLEKMPGKYIVSASGLAGFGSMNEIRTRKMSDRFYLCGDLVSDVNDGIGLVSARVMGCASHEAQTILRILTGEEDE
ncbi:MAG: thiamine biosynthesis protein ThiF [Clostridiales bacterium]|nr:thiamine biosynthesis protein ThiF [Clostridiales bacterium]